MALVCIVDGMSGVQTGYKLLECITFNGKISLGVARRTGTRANAVNTNTIFELLVREGSCECHDGSLGRRIVEEIATTNVWIDRCTIDNGGSSFHVR